MSKTTENKKFEDALSELEQVVKDLESNKFGLEEGIEKFENGISLYKHCKTILDKAEKKISKINETLEQQ
jgi:exodeoxyribonuclease VII small subunit